MKRTKLYKNNKLNPNHFLARIILWYRKHFGESIFYSVELNKSYKFTSFFKKYLLLFVFLILPVFIAIIAYIVIKSNEDMKISESVSSFELISLLITYISSTLLGVVVYYHSWLQGKLEEKKNGISLSVQNVIGFKDGIFCGSSQEEIDDFFEACRYEFLGLNTGNCNFIEFVFNNMNHHSPLNVDFKDLFYLNEDGNVKKLLTSLITDYDDESDMLEFKKPKTFFVGIDNELFNADYLIGNAFVRFFSLFEVSNLDGHRAYCLSEVFIDSHGESFSGETNLLSIDKYKKLIENYDVEFLKDVSMQKMINGKIYNKINLYK